MGEDHVTQPPANVSTNLIGQRFNRWRCESYVEKRGSQHFWRFVCDCGKVAVKGQGHIVAGRSRSCGCLLREWLVDKNKSHGASKSREHVIWKAMNSRCSNPNHQAWDNYGGRGVTVCARWKGKDGFANFLADMGPCVDPYNTIERRDNAKGYEPGNCFWATRKTQSRNKRNNLLITYKGKTQCLSAWAEELKIHQGALYYRVVTAKWDVARAFETPSAKVT